MALHPNFSVTDPSAIHIGASPTQKKSADKSEDTVKITWNDEVSKQEDKEKDSFSFFDFLDIINPLQHIPIISSIYRHFTGDEIKPVSVFAGGALFGGPIGAAVSGVDAIIAQETGQYVGDRIFAGIMGDKPAPQIEVPEIQVAAATPAIEMDPFDDVFLFEDFASETEVFEHERKLSLARENYLKSLNLSSNQGPQISQLY